MAAPVRPSWSVTSIAVYRPDTAPSLCSTSPRAAPGIGTASPSTTSPCDSTRLATAPPHDRDTGEARRARPIHGRQRVPVLARPGRERLAVERRAVDEPGEVVASGCLVTLAGDRERHARILI